MIKILLSGCNGRMGRTISGIVAERGGMAIAAGFDLNPVKLEKFPVYADPMEYSGSGDVLIDFSNPKALPGLLAFCKKKQIPAVLATTGYSADDLRLIEAATAEVAIFRSANMSLGINLLAALAKRAAALLGDAYDIEIVERHHNKKLDAPSGTAILLADEISSALPERPEYVYERQSRRAERPKNEIGFHAVRGGTIVGDHDVIFAGTDEVIELRHSALSRGVFAAGAVKAAAFMPGKKPGLYSMEDIVKSIV
ncbi:4-hydroxy-tetrahydrodipicolinate reductase [Oscillospiraceae bacterium OttesenSCG-928-F05]|nr:4-hydroxy-tetrahydrodipicolinate reductase [Oscillospiraceae bacterium OttesenSCG-928-F05]